MLTKVVSEKKAMDIVFLDYENAFDNKYPTSCSFTNLHPM